MGAVTLRVVLVAPEISLQMPPPFVLTCHCAVGVGFPLATALKVASLPLSSFFSVNKNDGTSESFLVMGLSF